LSKLKERIEMLESKTGLGPSIVVCYTDGFSVDGKRMSNAEYKRWLGDQPEDREIYLIEVVLNEPPKM
jgi:hypothetical protein